LLSDLKAHSKIPFTHLLSAELFGTYKPSPAVYRGAAEKLGLPTKECVMVAAHLNDLRAAKSHGMQVVYVERPGEEDWSADEIHRARNEGWVDIWVSLGEGNRGFVTVAEKLGVDPPAGHARKLSSSA
jgi:2-haloacid dehalogenase